MATDEIMEDVIWSCNRAERWHKRRLRQKPVVFKPAEKTDGKRRMRRMLARQAGLPWGKEYTLSDAPNPNGNRHHRRGIVAQWRRYLKHEGV